MMRRLDIAICIGCIARIGGDTGGSLRYGLEAIGVLPAREYSFSLIPLKRRITSKPYSAIISY